jgi:hypothetical protein
VDRGLDLGVEKGRKEGEGEEEKGLEKEKDKGVPPLSSSKERLEAPSKHSRTLCLTVIFSFDYWRRD